MSANDGITHLSDDSFAGEVEQGKGLVVVDFWAEWCGPCRAIAPVLEQLATTYAGKLRVTKLDVDQHPRTPMKFNVRSIPTLLFFKNGQVADQVVGMRSKRDLKASFDRVLA